ncbi:uncharacterized protein [Parasteatoda tepidariorum]|uniref:uncharacterized protein isoform X3 n=1 Tax=Parasteatoda tepidariorum TaxID=114398 RepID=UPI0039BC4F46
METITIIKTSENGETTTEEAQVQEIEMEQSADEAVSYGTPKLVQWNENLALLLLNTYKEYVQEFASPFTKKKTVWKKISEILNNVHGLGVTPQQCENKFKSMTIAYRKACENNKKTVASHRSQALFKELDDLYRHNPVVHHIGVASSSSGFQFQNDGDSQAEHLLKTLVKGKPFKRKRLEIPDWVGKILAGIEKRHAERMEKYDRLISVLEKIANKP